MSNPAASQARTRSPQEGPARKSAIILATVTTLVLILLWLITRHSLATALSVSNTEVALSLNPHSPVATLVTAQRVAGLARDMRRSNDHRDARPRRNQTLNAGPGPEERHHDAERAATASRLRQLIGEEPLNASAAGILAQIAELDGDTGASNRLFYLAAQLSLHELLADYKVATQYYRNRNYASALYYADALLRADPASFPLVAPLLTAALATDGARPFLVRALAERPPWRNRFLTTSFGASKLGNIDAPRELLLALTKTAAPPALAELSGYLNFLFEKKLFSRAYAVWLEFLPVESLALTGYVFNGSFEAEPSGLPFDWTIGQATEAEVNIFVHPDDDLRKALSISFGPGRIDFPLVQETILLSPGNYQLSFLVKGELMAQRGLQWKVFCENGAAVDGSRMIAGRFPGWTRYESDVVIPGEGCGFQYLRLIHAARTPSEQYAHGLIWFDGLDIRRKSETSTLQ